MIFALAACDTHWIYDVEFTFSNKSQYSITIDVHEDWSSSKGADSSSTSSSYSSSDGSYSDGGTINLSSGSSKTIYTRKESVDFSWKLNSQSGNPLGFVRVDVSDSNATFYNR
jgi:hypothetical protein